MTDDPRLGYPSCSSLGRVMACPASVAREREAVKHQRKRKDDGSALSGTKIHAVLAGELDQSELGIWESVVADQCRELETELRAELGMADGTPGLMKFFGSRMWLHAPDEGTRTNLSGEVDVLYTLESAGTALIIDYKTGRVEVEAAADNWQMAGYAVVAFGTKAGLPRNLKTIYVAVIQPQATKKTTLAKYEISEIRQLVDRVERQLELAEHPSAIAVPGYHCTYCQAMGLAEHSSAKAVPGYHCTYCQARGSCKEAMGLVETALVPLNQVTVEKVGRKTNYVVPKPSPDALLKFLKQRRVMEAIMSAWMQYAKDDPPEGYELAEGNERVTITNIMTAWKRLKFVPLRHLLKAVSVSTSGLDEIVMKIGIPKKDARKWWRDKLQGAYEVTRDEPKLVEKKNDE